ncbi:MAG: LytTR family transcriptional regulator DNA-binding domain-containing protein [Myxococcaceae bacterium]|nr:LytTR family transcriptional regulator DNA-binding domain-containing protein [Myxococcaceae bacterium]
MTVRVFLVDDERLARVALRQLLDEHGGVEVIGEADSVASARAKLRELSPDVVFLDVQLGDGSGFEVLTSSDSWRTVFCTAWSEYAVRAFEVNALDYLVKPATPEVVARALARVGSKPASMGLRDDDLVTLREAQSMRLVPLSQVEFIKAADDYSEVHVSAQPMALVEVTLKDWEARLAGTSFVRIHRSTLVNVKHVASLRQDAGRWAMTLRSGATLEVSRRLAAEVRERLDAGR